MSNLSIFVDAATDIGRVKKVNQDNILVKIGSIEGSDFGLFVVCDGVGGLKEGEYASLVCINKIKKWWNENIIKILKLNDSNEIIVTINKILESINLDLIFYGNSKGIKLGTTISFLLIKENKYYIANVGDSRVYKYNNKLTMLTEDHSLINLLKKNKEIEENKISEVKRNVITQCVGVKRNMEIFNDCGFLYNKDCFLLASDGFYNKIKKFELEKAINEFNKNIKKNVIQYWINMVKSRGEKDNISAIVVACKFNKGSFRNRILEVFGFD